MKLKILVVLGLFLLISPNTFAAKRIDYYSASDILRDSGYATGRIAMINQLEIVDEIKANRVYLAKDQAGYKVVLNLVGRISTSPEFARVKRIKIGTTYAIFFKITRISKDNVIQGDVQAIGFPKEVKSFMAEREQERRPESFSEKRTIEQNRVVPESPVGKQNQPRTIEKKIEAKQGEPGPVEKAGAKPKIVDIVPPVVKKDESLQAPGIGEPQKAEVQPVVTEKNTSPVKIKEIAKPVGKTAQEARKISKMKGNWPENIILFIPLLIGALVAGLTYATKTALFIIGINKFDAWVISKQSKLKEQVDKGKSKRYLVMPILWILNEIIKISGKIQNEAIRCGAETTAYLYLLGIIFAAILIAFYAVIFLIILAIMALILIIIAAIWGWLESQKEGPTGEPDSLPWPGKRTIVGNKNVLEKGWLGETKIGHMEEKVFGGKEIHKEGLVFSEKVGEIKEDFFGEPSAILDKNGKEIGKMKDTLLEGKIIVDKNGNKIGEYNNKK